METTAGKCEVTVSAMSDFWEGKGTWHCFPSKRFDWLHKKHHTQLSGVWLFQGALQGGQVLPALVSCVDWAVRSTNAPVVYRAWASVRMSQLDAWFKSWVPDSVFSAEGGRSSVEAWYTIALEILEVLSGVAESDVHLFVAASPLMIGAFSMVSLAVLGCLVG